MTLNQSLALAIAIADLWLLAILLNRRTGRWLLITYLALVVPVYLIGEGIFHRHREPWQPLFWGPMTIAVAGEACWMALKGHWNQRLTFWACMTFGMIFSGFSICGGVGNILNPDNQIWYLCMVTGNWAAMGSCAVVGVATRDKAAGLVMLYCSAGSIVYPIYRMTPWVQETARLTSIVHSVHLVVVLTALLALRVRESLPPTSVLLRSRS